VETWRVETFDYDYVAAGRRAPDRLPALVEAHRRALERHRQPGSPVVLIGKSMGGRVGCHLSLEAPVDALVCLGYPLVGAGAAAHVRDAVLLALTKPVLFIQGTRDRMCPLLMLEDVRSRMRAPSELCVVDGGDHSLLVSKTALRACGETQDDVDARIFRAIEAFLARHVGGASA
jgi:hypothetical protein